jgi:hypothetical protein
VLYSSSVSKLRRPYSFQSIRVHHRATTQAAQRIGRTRFPLLGARLPQGARSSSVLFDRPGVSPRSLARHLRPGLSTNHFASDEIPETVASDQCQSSDQGKVFFLPLATDHSPLLLPAMVQRAGIFRRQCGSTGAALRIDDRSGEYAVGSQNANMTAANHSTS